MHIFGNSESELLILKELIGEDSVKRPKFFLVLILRGRESRNVTAGFERVGEDAPLRLRIAILRN